MQLAFVIETAPYDGVYDPSSGPGRDACAAIAGSPLCEESDGVPLFIANASQIANSIQQANPNTNVSFALVDYFATLGGHDDGDGLKYHVDISTFDSSASTFGTDVKTTLQDEVLGGGYVYPDSDLSDNILDSSSITTLYGTLVGSALNWSNSTHHVVVWMGDTAPRDPNYPENYTVSSADSNSGTSGSCEPAYNFSSVTSPTCEGWIASQDGNASDSIAAFAQSGPACAASVGGACTIDTIDLYSTPTDPNSTGWPCPGGANGTLAHMGGCPGGSLVRQNTRNVLEAGCDLANATGGTWDGPKNFTCPNGSTGTLDPVFVSTNGGTSYDPDLANPTLLSAFQDVGLGPVIPATFTAHGLPAGTTWGVRVMGGASAQSTGATLLINVSAGAHNYTVSTADRTYRAPGGSFSSNGTSAPKVNVTFVRVTFSVQFTESGLPVGTGWSMSVGGVVLASSSPTISYTETNGTYSYQIQAVPGWTTSNYSGSITVNGSAQVQPIAWTLATYAVQMTEQGLASGTEWWIDLTGGASFQSDSPTISFLEPNGTYAYSATARNSSYAGTSGSLRVDGATFRGAVAFLLVVYPVTFSADGLPAGINWSVTIHGTTITSPTTIQFDLPNGTYQYQVKGLPGWAAAASPGTLSVRGAAVFETIPWSAVTYQVTFAESGLANGSPWSVTLGSAREAGRGAVTFLGIPNGTYPYLIEPPAGITANPHSGSLAVRGANVTEAIAFTSPSSGFLGLSPVAGQVVLGSVLAALVVGVALAGLWVSRRRGRSPPRAR